MAAKQKRKEEEQERAKKAEQPQQPLSPEQMEYKARVKAAEEAYVKWRDLAREGLPADVKKLVELMRAADAFENAYALSRKTEGGTFYTAKGEMNWDMTPQAVALQTREDTLVKLYSEMLATEITWGVQHDMGEFSRESFLMERIRELPAEQRMALEAEMFFTQENVERITLAEARGDRMAADLMYMEYARLRLHPRSGGLGMRGINELPEETRAAMKTFRESNAFKRVQEDKQAQEKLRESLRTWETTASVWKAVHQTIFPFSYAAAEDAAKKGGLSNMGALGAAKLAGASALEAVMWAPVIKVGKAAVGAGWAAIQAARKEGLREALKRVVPAAVKTAVEAARKIGWKRATWGTAVYGVVYKMNLDEMIEVMTSDKSTNLEKAQAAINVARVITLTEGIVYCGGKLTVEIARAQLMFRCATKFVQNRLLKKIGEAVLRKLPKTARLEFRELLKKVTEQISSGKWKEATQALSAFGKKHGIEPLEKMTEALLKDTLKPGILKLIRFAVEMTAFVMLPWQTLTVAAAAQEYAEFSKKPGDTARFMQVEGREMQESKRTLDVVRGVTVEMGGEMLAGNGIGPEFAEAISEAEYVELRRRIPRMTAEKVKETFEEYWQLSDDMKKDISFAAYLAAKTISPELQTQIAELHEAFESIPEEERGGVAAASFRDFARTDFERFILTATSMAKAETNAEARGVIEEYAQLERTQPNYAGQMTLAEYVELRQNMEKAEILELAREYAKLDGKTGGQVKLSGYIIIRYTDPGMTNETLQEAAVEFTAIKEREPIERGLIGDRLMTEFETATRTSGVTQLEEEAQRLAELIGGLKETG